MSSSSSSTPVMNQEIAMKIKENRCAPRYDHKSLFLSQLSEADTDENHDTDKHVLQTSTPDKIKQIASASDYGRK